MSDKSEVEPIGEWERDESYGGDYSTGDGEMSQYLLRYDDGKPTVGIAYHTDGEGDGALFLSLRDPISEDLEQVHLVKGSERKVRRKLTRWMKIIKLTDSPTQFSPRLHFFNPVLLYEALRLLLAFSRKD